MQDFSHDHRFVVFTSDEPNIFCRDDFLQNPFFISVEGDILVIPRHLSRVDATGSLVVSYVR